MMLIKKHVKEYLTLHQYRGMACHYFGIDTANNSNNVFRIIYNRCFLLNFSDDFVSGGKTIKNQKTKKHNKKIKKQTINKR